METINFLDNISEEELSGNPLFQKAFIYAKELKEAKTDVDKLYRMFQKDIESLDTKDFTNASRSMGRNWKKQYIQNAIDAGVINGCEIREIGLKFKDQYIQEEKDAGGTGMYTDDEIVEKSLERQFSYAVKRTSLQELHLRAHNTLKKHLQFLENLPLEDQAEYYEKQINAISLSLAIFDITGVFEFSSDGSSVRTTDETQVNQYNKTRELFLHKLNKIKEYLNKDWIEVDFEETTQKIAWMHELGVLKVIFDKCTEGNTINVSKAANIVASFAETKPGQTRKCLEAIYKSSEAYTGETSEKIAQNNPLKSEDTIDYLKTLKRKFKI